jgi:hypothetical protein
MGHFHALLLATLRNRHGSDLNEVVIWSVKELGLAYWMCVIPQFVLFATLI